MLCHWLSQQCGDWRGNAALDRSLDYLAGFAADLKLYEKWAVLDVRRYQYEYANENLKMVNRRVQEGLTAKVEINRAQIGVAERNGCAGSGRYGR